MALNRSCGLFHAPITDITRPATSNFYDVRILKTVVFAVPQHALYGPAQNYDLLLFVSNYVYV